MFHQSLDGYNFVYFLLCWSTDEFNSRYTNNDIYMWLNPNQGYGQGLEYEAWSNFAVYGCKTGHPLFLFIC